MLRTVIIDDEPQARRRLLELLKPEPDFEVVAELDDGDRARRGLRGLDPDVLFAGVEMPGLSGMDLMELIHSSFDTEPAAVFVTAHDEYAVQAFEEGAVDYLVKPFDADRFAKTLRRIREWHVPSGAGVVPAAVPGPARLAVKVRDGIRVLRFEEIDWVEAAGNYVQLHVGKQVSFFRETIQHFERMLARDGFVRINRSTLVNVDRIAYLQPSFNRGHLVILRDGARLTLSRGYRARLEPHVLGLA